MPAFSNVFVIMRVAGDQRFVGKEYGRKIFEHIVTAAYLKKQQISQESL